MSQVNVVERSVSNSVPYFEVSGRLDGDPVVLLHGWGSSAELMRPIARMLEDQYRILNIDLPGHGKTPAPTEAVGVEDYALIVAQVMRQQAFESATIIGHSNGGRVGLFMASDDRYASSIRRLVLISPSGIRPKRSAKVRFKSMVASVLKAPFKLLPPGAQSAGLSWLRDSAIWRLLGSSDYQALSGVMRETFVKTVSCHLDDRLSRITVPTLIFWGDKDTDVRWHQISVLKSGIADVGVVTLKGAGHYGYLDAPGTVRAGIRHFLGPETNAS